MPIIMPQHQDLAHISTIARIAQHRRWLIMTAESCSGGLLAAALTEIAGASQWFSGGIVAYSNTQKQQLLQVSGQTLARCGAVSEETAAAMSAGLPPLGADAGVSVTGIAGPGGGETKPVGTVCFGIITPAGSSTTTRQFSGDRHAIRAAAVSGALEQLAAALDTA